MMKLTVSNPGDSVLSLGWSEGFSALQVPGESPPQSNKAPDLQSSSSHSLPSEVWVLSTTAVQAQQKQNDSSVGLTHMAQQN